MPSPIGVADLSAGVSQAASNSFGSLYLSPRTMMAHAIRAILLASATAAKLMPPSYVKAYLKRSKNDANDAAAICEAVTRPSMRFVPIQRFKPCLGARWSRSS
jgi:transposase